MKTIYQLKKLYKKSHQKQSVLNELGRRNVFGKPKRDATNPSHRRNKTFKDAVTKLMLGRNPETGQIE